MPVLGTGGYGVETSHELPPLFSPSACEEEKPGLNSRRRGALSWSWKNSGKGGTGRDTDREGLKNQDKERGMCWVFSRY